MKHSCQNCSFLGLSVLGLLIHVLSFQLTLAESITKTYQVYHSIKPRTNPNAFSRRGDITLSSTDDDVAVSFQEADQGGLSQNAFEDLDALVESNGLYRLKLVDEETGRSVLASVPSCEVRKSNFREEISLTLGYNGDLLSVSYIPLVSSLALPCHELPPLSTIEDDVKQKLSFHTTVKYTTGTQASSLPIVMPQMKPPPGLSWMKRQGKSSTMPQSTDSTSPNSKESPFYDPEKDGKKHESFLMKYWYIILPLAIITFLTPEEPPQQGSRGGATQKPSLSTGTSVPNVASSNVTSTAPRQRRGKRST